MRWTKLIAVVCAACLVMGAIVTARQLGRQNTWSARSSTGQTFMGTWTVKVDSATGNAAGTWTLVDATSKTLASGVWSASKAANGWNGSWRAAATGRAGEYSGTWSAMVDVSAGPGFPSLFEKAAQAVVSGAWRAGQRSGSWSIRAYQ